MTTPRMTLFDLTPITVDQLRKGRQASVTLKDKKGRAIRRRPYWIDLGKGPEGTTCKTCQYLVRTEYAFARVGICACGCGGDAPVATETDSCNGYIKGQPKKFILYKVYFKCGTWKITGGPGTQIATTDPACVRYQRKGRAMFSIKEDR